MAHSPELPGRYVCENCQLTHAGTPIHESASSHTFEAPEACGGCGDSSFVELSNWVHFHE